MNNQKYTGIALNNTATQSTTKHGGEVFRVVAGCTKGAWGNGSVVIYPNPVENGNIINPNFVTELQTDQLM